MTHLHFGAGALGRGLVLPRIVAAGGEVVVADTDPALISRLRDDGGYTLSVVGAGGRRTDIVPVAAAHCIGADDAALDAAIAAADTVTTSVQVGNLARVVARLAPVWQRGPARTRVIVGCENLRHVGDHIAALFAEAGGVVGLQCPDCLVDRICATSADGTTIEAEDYSEWVIDGDTARPGPDTVPDVEGLFFRKRYLVNTLADACAFVGRARGAAHLHEAVSDPAVRATVAPLVDLLCDHLAGSCGFAPEALTAYRNTSVARLSHPGISRRIETVARDPWRKFAPDERFLEPVLAIRAGGGDIDGALAALAAILRAVEPAPDVLSARLTHLWSGTAAEPLAHRIAGMFR